MNSKLWKVDLHSHTIYSKDCLTRTAALIDHARQVGLTKIAVTEHNRLDGALRAKELAPDLVIVGEEIKTTHGEIIPTRSIHCAVRQWGWKMC